MKVIFNWRHANQAGHSRRDVFRRWRRSCSGKVRVGFQRRRCQPRPEVGACFDRFEELAGAEALQDAREAVFLEQDDLWVLTQVRREQGGCCLASEFGRGDVGLVVGGDRRRRAM